MFGDLPAGPQTEIDKMVVVMGGQFGHAHTTRVQCSCPPAPSLPVQQQLGTDWSWSWREPAGQVATPPQARVRAWAWERSFLLASGRGRARAKQAGRDACDGKSKGSAKIFLLSALELAKDNTTAHRVHRCAFTRTRHAACTLSLQPSPPNFGAKCLLLLAVRHGEKMNEAAGLVHL